MTRRLSSATHLPKGVCSATARSRAPAVFFTSRHASAPIVNRLASPQLAYSGFKPTGLWSSSAGRRGFCSTLTTRSCAGEDDERSQQTRPRRNPLILTAARVIAIWIAANAALEITGIDEALTNLAVGKPLNDASFVPFTVVSREQVSPTSFILGVRPRFGRGLGQQDTTSAALSLLFPRARFPRESHTSRPALEQAWQHGLWSVEIKQPQLQVARDYTPLPAPSRGAEKADLDRGELRFLIRKMDGGEVSTYLSRLRIGDIVELRGPHLGFDVRARLGSADKLVFLAGGTGVAPALQTIRALLEHRPAAARTTEPSISLIWANRHHADCRGARPPSADPSMHATTTMPSPNAVVSLLKSWKRRHGDALHYACTVDEEGSYIASADILQTTGFYTCCNPAPASGWWFASRNAADKRHCLDPSPVNATSCSYHSAAILTSSTGNDPFANPLVPAAGAKTQCACIDAQGLPTAGGKNLLMVSGPEGFVTAYAGTKVWSNGKELQGPVGGVVGAWEKTLPRFWAEWLVLKL